MKESDAMRKDEKNFLDKEFKELMPSTTKLATLGVIALVVNAALFVGAIGVIAYAVKWVISSQ
ncbi:MAG: hypothetical protein ACXABY_08105 [Candidatus Thorarchaeota archaeon]|jgi:hypothetical protein